MTSVDFDRLKSLVGWAKPTGPAFGRPDDRLRVPTCGLTAWARREERAFAHPTSLAALLFALSLTTALAQPAPPQPAPPAAAPAAPRQHVVIGYVDIEGDPRYEP